MPGLARAHHHMWLGAMRRMMLNVDDLFTYIDIVGEKMGAHYRPLDMYLSTMLTAVTSLDTGIRPSLTPATTRAAPSTPTPRSMRWRRPASARCTWPGAAMAP